MHIPQSKKFNLFKNPYPTVQAVTRGTIITDIKIDINIWLPIDTLSENAPFVILEEIAHVNDKM